ncbi:VOC family protein [Sphingomonas sp. SRS2]|uniref:VOC family protein n=1 Tax=Sphingomonas sp. SRS2 TaxID=133190 RepID=UPI0006184CFD|nr:VOC family protein [Sphingomonas sp. SRS2]KKC24793.1 glyoxalase [Sphingomonas sp. SRS2]
MIHHVSVGSNDIGQARAFYGPVLEVLGMRLLADHNSSLDYGSGTVEFSVETPSDGAAAAPGNGVHIAFAAEDRAMVDRFHAIGLASGGADAGSPGIRAKYDRNYYGAFLRDPDGNKIEAVTFSAE